MKYTKKNPRGYSKPVIRKSINKCLYEKTEYRKYTLPTKQKRYFISQVQEIQYFCTITNAE